MTAAIDDTPRSLSATKNSTTSKLNRLRAGVLGANDGIVSIAGVVVGVAATTSSIPIILTAGIAALAAGALSMAVGEYVSVSTQRDTEEALVAGKRRQLEHDPHTERDRLASIYEAKGLSTGLAHQVAMELSAHNALEAHADVELNLNPDDLTSPLEAAIASIIAFTIGGLLPVLAILGPVGMRIPLTFAVVLLALAGTGWLSARLGHAPVGPAVLRTVLGGAFAMVVTYAIGSVVNVNI